ncbi:MAG: efflux RND transporter permease subunit [Haliea sp.]|nr:efflux RND transporter permease subunit [Haliea sp.]
MSSGITLPLEEELLEVEGIKKLYSNSAESLSVITLNLDLVAANKQDIMRDIQQAVDRAAARLPADLLEKPLVEALSSAVTPVMEVHVTGAVPEALLRDVARNLADGLREVEGVASIEKSATGVRKCASCWSRKNWRAWALATMK